MHSNNLLGKILMIIFIFPTIAFVGNTAFSSEKLSRITIEDVNVQPFANSATIAIAQYGDKPVGEITKDRFLLFIDEQVVPKKDFILNPSITGSTAGHLIIVWDISKSVAKVSWQDGQNKALSILEMLGTEFNLSLISVGDIVENVIGFTKDRTLLRDKLSSLSPISNRTLLNESIYYAIEQLESYNGGKRAILLFTDGIDDGSYLSRGDCIEKIKEKKMPVIAFDLGNEHKRGSAFLKRIARVSGGIYLNVNQEVDTKNIIETVISQSRTSYAVSFDHPRLSNPGSHEIKIAIEDPDTGIIKAEASKQIFVPFAKPEWRGSLIINITIIILLFLSGAVALTLYFKYLNLKNRMKNNIEKVVVVPAELGELRKGVEKLQKETDNLGKQVWNYGGIREERIHRWREACFATAGKAVSVLKTCWLERDNPVGKAIYDELVLSLKTIGLEVIKPEIGEKINENDRRYWIKLKRGIPPYTVSKLIYPGYYFRPRLGEVAEDRDEILLEPTQIVEELNLLLRSKKFENKLPRMNLEK
jgi:hypothetical protein